MEKGSCSVMTTYYKTVNPRNFNYPELQGQEMVRERALSHTPDSWYPFSSGLLILALTHEVGCLSMRPARSLGFPILHLLLDPPQPHHHHHHQPQYLSSPTTRSSSYEARFRGFSVGKFHRGTGSGVGGRVASPLARPTAISEPLT